MNRHERRRRQKRNFQRKAGRFTRRIKWGWLAIFAIVTGIMAYLYHAHDFSQKPTTIKVGAESYINSRVDTIGIVTESYGRSWSDTILAMDLLKTFSTQLPEYSDDNESDIGATINAVKSQLPHCRALIIRAYAVSPGLDIDMIAQAHMSVTPEVQLESKMEATALRSQSLIMKLLTTGEYGVVAVEGTHFERVIIDSIVDDIYALGVKKGIIVSRGMIREKITKNSAYSYAGIQYAFDNPQAVVIGAEIASLNHLHILMGLMLLRVSGASTEISQLTELYTNISRLRSQIALCRLVLKMHKLGVRKGALIMGAKHFDELVLLATKMGLRFRVLTTVHL